MGKKKKGYFQLSTNGLISNVQVATLKIFCPEVVKGENCVTWSLLAAGIDASDGCRADEQEDIMKSAGTELHTQSILEMWQNKGIIFQPFFWGVCFVLFWPLEDRSDSHDPTLFKLAPLSRSVSQRKPDNSELREMQLEKTGVVKKTSRNLSETASNHSNASVPTPPRVWGITSGC